jgi:pimeloyl-ACP methyl ester carboxylesterase
VIPTWTGWLRGWRTPQYARRPPLVLVNGLAEQAETWYCNGAVWGRHFEVHAPNLLVYDGDALHRRIDAGLTITVEYLAERLREYLDSYVQTPPYHLAANSLGGKIAVEFAARYPRRVSRLVLLCPSGLGEGERLPLVEGVRRGDVAALVQSVFWDPRRLDPRVVVYYQMQFARRRWRRGLLRTIRGTMDHGVRGRLGRVPHPTLVVSGREDRIVDPQSAAEAVRLLPQGQHVVIAHCGHAPQIEKRRRINRLVLDFLTDPRPSTRIPLRRLRSAEAGTVPERQSEGVRA